MPRMSAMSMMKAVVQDGVGVLRYGEALRAVAGAGEVLVRVAGAGVNPIDWKVRDGFGAGWLVRPEPGILGFDLAGVVEEVGEGVRRLKVGDAVFGCMSLKRNGAFAEFAAAGEGELAHKPESVGWAEAAGAGTVGLTAWQGLFEIGDLQPGMRVLIHAAAGGVGSMAVQLAKWRGAHVTGVASGRNQVFCRHCGADDYIDYTAQQFEAAGREQFDLVLDTIGGDYQRRSLAVLKRGGVLVSVAEPVKPELAEAHGVRSGMVRTRPDADQLERLAELMERGVVKVPVEIVLPLSRFDEALSMSESGRTRGKIVLVPESGGS